MANPVEPNKNYEVFDEDLEFRIREISEFANANTPDGTGVIVLMAKPTTGDEVSFFFMSNMPRLQVLRLLRTYLESEEAKDKMPE